MRTLLRSLLALVVISTLPLTARAAEADDVAWWDRARYGQAGHYWIKTDIPEDETRELARHLNFMYEAFHHRLGSLPQREPEQLNAYIFASYVDYLATLGSRFGVNAMGTGGMFFVSPQGTGLAFWTEDLPRQRVLHVLQHEAFHQFAYSRFGGDLPIWVNEGLAEFFAEAVLVGRTLVIGQSNSRVIETVKHAVEKSEHVPFRDMLTMSSARWFEAIRAGQAQLQYHQAWSMVHFLIYGEGGRYRMAFEQYLRLLANGAASEDAFIRAFGTDDFYAFEQRWKAYALQARPGAFVTALERAEFLAEGLLELSRRKVYPQSMEELKEALRDIGFTFTFRSHGIVTVLSAEEDVNFTIPKDDQAREQPVFALSPPRQRRLPHRQRQLEEENPTPSTLRTEHLRPHGISIEWKRDQKTNTFSYELIVR